MISSRSAFAGTLVGGLGAAVLTLALRAGWTSMVLAGSVVVCLLAGLAARGPQDGARAGLLAAGLLYLFVWTPMYGLYVCDEILARAAAGVPMETMASARLLARTVDGVLLAGQAAFWGGLLAGAGLGAAGGRIRPSVSSPGARSRLVPLFGTVYGLFMIVVAVLVLLPLRDSIEQVTPTGGAALPAGAAGVYAAIVSQFALVAFNGAWLVRASRSPASAGSAPAIVAGGVLLTAQAWTLTGVGLVAALVPVATIIPLQRGGHFDAPATIAELHGWTAVAAASGLAHWMGWLLVASLAGAAFSALRARWRTHRPSPQASPTG